MVTTKAPQPRILRARGPAPAAAAPGAGGAAGAHVVQSAGTQPAPEGAREAPALVDFTLYFEDWREADGVKFPFKMRRASAGTTTEEWTVSRIKVNPKVDPKRFAGES
jgi:hypothetical protein